MKLKYTASFLMILLIFICIFFVNSYIFLPLGYYVTIIGISCLLSVYIYKSITSKKMLKTNIFFMILIFVLLTSMFYISTDCNVLFGADTYREFAASEYFSSINKVQQLPMWESPNYLSYTTGFPVFPLFLLSLSKITGLNLHNAFVFIMPTFFSVLFFLLVLLFMKLLSNEINLDSAIIVALAIMIIHPFSIYWFINLSHQSMGLLIFVFVLYVIYCNLKKTSIGKDIIILIFVITLVLTHHFTTVILIMFLIFWYILDLILNKIEKKKKVFSKRIFIITSLILAAITFVWWNNFAVEMWDLAGSRLLNIIQVLVGEKNTKIYVPQKFYPESLTNFWDIAILQIRNIIIITLTIISIICTWKYRFKLSEKFFKFLLLSCFDFGILFVFSVTVSWIEPYRILIFSIPIASIVWGFLIFELIKSKKNVLIFSITIAISLFSAFLGLWGIRYVPEYLYNKNISLTQLGEHNKSWLTTNWYTKKINCKDIDFIFADDEVLLYPLVPASQYKKIHNSEYNYVKKYYNYKWVFYEFRDFNKFLVHDGRSKKIINENRINLKKQMHKKNKIYNGNEIKIWGSML